MELKHGRSQEAGADAETIKSGAAYSVAQVACSVFSLKEARATNPRMAPLSKGWALLPLSVMKMLYKLVYQAILWKDFLN